MRDQVMVAMLVAVLVNAPLLMQTRGEAEEREALVVIHGDFAEHWNFDGPHNVAGHGGGIRKRLLELAQASAALSMWWRRRHNIGSRAGRTN